jgi:NodT family efflux transporter outer membrane factor (OMF) lipoprotein
MKTNNIIFYSLLILVVSGTWSCSSPGTVIRSENKNVPASYSNSQYNDTVNSARINWRNYFHDPHLIALIDTALQNNQELNIMLQEIEISKNEIRARKGEYLPFVNLGAGAGAEKPGEFTRNGAVEKQLEVKPGQKFPDPLQDYYFGAVASWEIDVWKKLRNARQSAAMRYLASVEGRNFMVTRLIAEIAESYYELLALDNMLEMIDKNIDIQSNALKVVKQQKESAKVSQLAVNRFEAQLLNTQNMQYEVRQKIVETENRINFLTGRFPTPIQRNSAAYLYAKMDTVLAGIPAHLLNNRTDVRQAEYELAASRLDVKSVKARFYPNVAISAGVGFQAFNPAFLLHPESMLYNLAGDIAAPLINRNAIKAAYRTANAKQMQAVLRYEQTLLNAYLDVLNQQAKLENYRKSFDTKHHQVEILTESITISNNLFNSARADYAEVLLTQREALESKMELIEIKQKQYNAQVNIYRALGGGWK